MEIYETGVHITIPNFMVIYLLLKVMIYCVFNIYDTFGHSLLYITTFLFISLPYIKIVQYESVPWLLVYVRFYLVLSDKQEVAHFYRRCKAASNRLSGACSQADSFVCRLIARQRVMSLKRSGMRMSAPQ